MSFDDDSRPAGTGGEPVLSPDGAWEWDGAQWQPRQPGLTRQGDHSPQTVGALYRPVPGAIPGPDGQQGYGQPSSGPGGPGRSKKPLAIGAAVIVVAAVVVGIVLATRGGGGGSTGSQAGSSPQAPTPTVLTSPNSVCALEANAALDNLANNPGTNLLVPAIGVQTPIYNIALGSLGDYLSIQAQYGASTAEDRIATELKTKCSQANNSVLNQGQLSALEQIATPSDASQLGTIQYFG